MNTTAIRKILTISIPTWNRGVLVKELLENITREIAANHLEDNVEVQITNNASTDDTESIILDFAKKHSYIFYTNNGVNIGLGPNVLKCMQLANGKYCLLLGDDDRLSSGALLRLINFLEKHPDTGLLVDTTNHKKYKVEQPTLIGLSEFLEKYYYYMGNAGVFVVDSSYIRENYDNRDFKGISFSWPQTQFMIVSSYRHPENKIYLVNFNMHGGTEHANVTLYNSFYLWKVAYYELIADIENIRQWLDDKTYKAARNYFSNEAVQNFFNILQCGVFVDDEATRKKTRKSIAANLKYFTLKEKALLSIIIVALWMPPVLAKSMSDAFIFLTRGKKGLDKKNNFVKAEKEKQLVFKRKKETIIRQFSYDNSGN